MQHLLDQFVPALIVPRYAAGEDSDSRVGEAGVKRGPDHLVIRFSQPVQIGLYGFDNAGVPDETAIRPPPTQTLQQSLDAGVTHANPPGVEPCGAGATAVSAAVRSRPFSMH